MSLALNKLISFINLGRFCNFNLSQQSDTVQIKNHNSYYKVFSYKGN